MRLPVLVIFTATFSSTVGACQASERSTSSLIVRAISVASDDGEGWAVTSFPGRVLRSVDSGRSWAVVASVDGAGFLSFSGVQRYQNAATNILFASVDPRLVQAVPSSFPQDSDVTIVLTGQNTTFLESTTVDIAGSGVIVASIERLSPISLSLNLVVASDAAIGFRDATASTILAAETTEIAMGTGVFQITEAVAEPTLVSAAPPLVTVGETVDVVLRGSRTSFGEGVSVVDFGPGIDVSGVTVVSTAELIATVTVDADAVPGARRVTVSTDGEIAQNRPTDFFRVAAAVPIPSIVGASPDRARRGDSVLFELTVANLELDEVATELEITGGGVLVENTAACGDRLIADVTVLDDAALGARDVVVSSGDETVALPNGFTVADAIRQDDPLGRTDLAQKGSLLIWPAVELGWSASSQIVRDTAISLLNDFPRDVYVQLYFVNGDAPLNAIYTGDPPMLVAEHEPGWNSADCQFVLTANQPTYWSLASGRNATGQICQPFTVLDPGPPAGRPDPSDSSGRRMLRGYIVAWAVDASGEEIRWNHLSGSATIVDYANGTASEYNAYSFQSNQAEHGQPTDDDPGLLLLNGVEYDGGFDALLFNFFASGSTAASAGATVASIDTSLTLLPISNDFRQDGLGPVTTKAQFDIWNQNERRFSGTTRCISCWDQTLLSRYDAPNHFLVANLQTDKGKARINGVASADCGGSVEASLLGVATKIIAFSGATSGVAESARSLVGQGHEAGMIDFDVIRPPGELLHGGLDATRIDRQGETRWQSTTPRPKEKAPLTPRGR